MSSTGMRRLARGVNRLLAPIGVRVTRVHDWSDPKEFLPFRETISGARGAGLSVGDYVDVTYNVAGATQMTIDAMADMKVFAHSFDTVVEIGPGSGRYLEKVKRECSPRRYEIYETAGPWADYLERTYGVISQPTDGNSLRSTRTGTVDLVQAHKVFVVTGLRTTCRYWLEMLRVVKPRAFIVFDIVTEDCLDPETLDTWLEFDWEDETFPTLFPRQFTVDFFESRGAKLVGSFQVPMKPGTTETFVFRVQ
jgi:hypothetical protein